MEWGDLLVDRSSRGSLPLNTLARFKKRGGERTEEAVDTIMKYAAVCARERILREVADGGSKSLRLEARQRISSASKSSHVTLGFSDLSQPCLVQNSQSKLKITISLIFIIQI